MLNCDETGCLDIVTKNYRTIVTPDYRTRCLYEFFAFIIRRHYRQHLNIFKHLISLIHSYESEEDFEKTIEKFCKAIKLNKK